MPKLYSRTIATEVAVYADSPEEATRIITEDLRNIVQNETFDVEDDGEMVAIPGGWDDTCIPYGNVGDLTLGELMKPPEDPTNGGITPILPGIDLVE